MPSIIKALEIRAQLPHHDEARVVRLDVTEGSEKSRGQVLELQGLDSFDVDVNTANAAMGGSVLYNSTPTDRDIVLRVKPYFGFENTLVNLMSEYQMYSTASNEYYIFLDVIASDGVWSCPIIVTSASAPIMQDTDEVTIELLSPKHLFYSQKEIPTNGQGAVVADEPEGTLIRAGEGIEIRSGSFGPRKFKSSGETLYGYGFWISRDKAGMGLGPMDYDLTMYTTETVADGRVFGVATTSGEFFGARLFPSRDWHAQGGHKYVRFKSDGTYYVARYANDARNNDPSTVHQPIFEGHRGIPKLMPNGKVGFVGVWLPETPDGWKTMITNVMRFRETRLGF